MDPIQIARAVAEDLVKAGALAVVLAGSHARGEASARSDLDLYAIGSGPTYQLQLQHGMLVSVSWRSVEDERGAFQNPGLAGAAVPGWRSAVFLYDPQGIAAVLVDEAQRWTWGEVGDDRLNAWVADELTGFAEEVFKLVAMLEQGRLQPAAVQRSVIALRVPVILATHLRLLYDSENVLWDLVAERMGPEWTRIQATALGLMDRPNQEMCHAALQMFVEACGIVRDLFDGRQLDVVEAAIEAARSVSPAINSNSTVVVLVERDGKYLMIEEMDSQGNPAWYFPAGAVEPGESLAEAAEREVLEETGWPVDPGHLLRIDHGYFRRSPAVPWWRHVIVARPRPGASPAAPEDSILNVEWLAVAEIEKLTLRGNDAIDLIRTYLEHGPGAAVRDYRFCRDGTLEGFYC